MPTHPEAPMRRKVSNDTQAASRQLNQRSFAGPLLTIPPPHPTPPNSVRLCCLLCILTVTPSGNDPCEPTRTIDTNHAQFCSALCASSGDFDFYGTQFGREVSVRDVWAM